MMLFFVLLSILSVTICHATENCTLECEKKEKSLSYLDVALEMITKVKVNFPTCPNIQHKPSDCEEVQKIGNDKSGIYTLWPKSRVLEGKSIDVYCDMDTDGGGWTVIQRRGNFGFPKDYFYREWISYKNGFGELDKEFWLGNDNIFALTNQKLCSARFDLRDVEGDKAYALYDKFWIDDELNNYALHLYEYSGTAGESLIDEHDTQRFSTKDKDNDHHRSNCADKYKSGWWFNACYHTNLNGLNLRGKHTSDADGINWKTYRFLNESLDWTEIKIRSKSYRKISILTGLEINSNAHEKSETPKE